MLLPARPVGWIGLALLPVLSCAASALAAPITWPFNVSTAGQNVSWVSPTALDPNADLYVMGWNITLVEVTLKPPVFPAFTLDVTDQIPPEQRQGTQTVNGPAPIVAFSDRVQYPEPPTQPAAAADVVIGLNAGGYGYVDVTNVVLGTYVYNGITMQVQRIHLAGTVTVEQHWWQIGDMNCDGIISFADINPFVLALTGEAAYSAAFPGCKWLNGDVNGDGTVDFADINPFVALLVG